MLALLCRVLVYEPIMEGRLVPLTTSTAAEAAAEAVPDSEVVGGVGETNAAATCATAAPAGVHGSGCNVGTQGTWCSINSSRRRISSSSSSALADGVNQPARDCGGAFSRAAQVTGAPTQLRRAAALHATFAFSGAWHTLIFYYATGVLTWHWFAFFSMQVPAAQTSLAAQPCMARSMLRAICINACGTNAS